MSKWQDNIKMDFKSMIQEYVDWIYLAYDKMYWTCCKNGVENKCVLKFCYKT